MAMLGGQAVPPIEAWPLLRVEPMSYLRPEVWNAAYELFAAGSLEGGDEGAVGGSDELVSGAS